MKRRWKPLPREALSKRSKWQGEAGAKGRSAEDIFTVVMKMHLKDDNFELERQPSTLRGIYGERGRPGGRMRPHGIVPECEIRNPKNGKRIFVEVKRRKAEGNAHERACNYMMPGIVKARQGRQNAAARDRSGMRDQEPQKRQAHFCRGQASVC